MTWRDTDTFHVSPISTPKRLVQLRTPLSSLLQTSWLLTTPIEGPEGVGRLGSTCLALPCSPNSGSLVRREGSGRYTLILGPLLPHSASGYYRGSLLLGKLPGLTLALRLQTPAGGTVPTPHAPAEVSSTRSQENGNFMGSLICISPFQTPPHHHPILYSFS